MVKKRFLLAFVLVIILVLTTSEVLAGCCVGIIGCSRAFFNTECSDLATFTSDECEEIADCDIVACCHDIPGMSMAQYRSTCLGMAPPLGLTFIKPFSTNPASETAFANNLCSGANPPCTFVGCEQANAPGCMCGSAVTSDDSTYCCARDSSVFPNFGACSASPSCRAADFFNIFGDVITPDGFGILGAEIRVGGKSVFTNDTGGYMVELIPDESSGTIVAIKDSTINSTAYTINSADFFADDIILDIIAEGAEGREDCEQEGDDDGDQFGWASPVADRCDTDCVAYFSINLRKTVTETYYNSGGEYYEDLNGIQDLCFDGFDNDCDGYQDCEDPACSASPACQATFCGDGAIQFPNANAQYEQCDINPDTGLGNDSLCPGSCIAPGESNECMCGYEATCGNGVIDEPFESCDGSFDVARDVWLSAGFKTEWCTEAACGKPNSVRPCQCPPPQICGNNVVEDPEQCDGDDDSACEGQCSPDCRCPPTEAICGNNLLEYGEDCDGTFNQAENGWEGFKTRKYGCGPSICALPQDATSYVFKGDIFLDYAEYLDAVGVDAACKCPTQCRHEPPGPVLECVNQTRMKREILLEWSDACMNDNAKAYNIHRCTAESPEDCVEGGVFSVINEAPLGLTTVYSDTTFIGSTPGYDVYHCYMVEGIYETDSPNNIKRSEFNSEVHCIRAGDEQCFSFRENYPWADEFCAGEDNNVRSTCDENNAVVMVNYTGQVIENVDCSNDPLTPHICIGPYSATHPSLSGKTQCVPQSICDYCNDPFGFFAFSSDTGRTWEKADESLLVFGVGKAPDTFPTDREKLDRFTYRPCFNIDVCYMDYSYTSINKFYSYDQPTSCYDFNSLQACRKFNDTTGGGLCEWEWHPIYQELGVGVCRTNVTEEQDCERCHDPSNKVFGRCDKESCSLYGRCYYDQEDGFPGQDFGILAHMTVDNPVIRADKVDDHYYKCTNERDISCENYDSMEDCIGSHSPYSIDGSNNLTADVEVDVFGYLNGSMFEKTRGTNIMTTPSDDFFSFGKCQWARRNITVTQINEETGERISESLDISEFKCFKNSDASPYVIETNSGYGEENILIYQRSDCGDFLLNDDPVPSLQVLPDIMDCRKDFTEPITNVPHYEDAQNPMRVSANFAFPAIVSDNSVDYSGYYPDTYACIADDASVCYPRGVAEKLGRDIGNLIHLDDVNINVSYDYGELGILPGVYDFVYFSEDMSHNLEELRTFPIYIDPDTPNVVLIFTNTSFEIYEDVWRTNLSLDMSIIPRYVGDDEYAFCDAKMYKGNASIYPLQDIISEYNNSWERNYSEMLDDYYRFWYRCVDDVGNIAEENVTIIIDGDKSITDPQPRGTLNDGSVQISVETGTNAECRYIYSLTDRPEFWSNRSFDPEVFDGMTLFEVTGSAETSATVHRANVELLPGYHRYYVKCRMLNDGKIKGNSADEVRFAVDKAAPVTFVTTDVSPYNSWFNQDVQVSLLCGDLPLIGAGLDWSFGCDRTFYCIGLDCKDFEGKFKEYDEQSPMRFNQTQYITYYSVDKGGNSEVFVENMLLQIDKTKPELTVEFYDGNTLTDTIIMNIVYRVRVTSSKPFISMAVSRPFISFNSNPGKFGGEIELMPTGDQYVWEGVFYLENINANKDFEGEGIFTAIGVDHHNVSGTGVATLRIDTKPPEMPIVQPSLVDPSPDVSDYQLIGYPIHYYDGIYYTNNNHLFITGYTGEYLDMRAVTSVEGVDSELIFTQTPTTVAFEDKVMSGFEGTHEIKIFGDITRRANKSLYIGFDAEETLMGPMVSYGNYGKFYDITDLIYHGGDEQYTSISIYPIIEESLQLDRQILFYDKENPSLWFGLDIPIADSRNTTFYLKSYDSANNLIRFPEISAESPYLTFFGDFVSPSVISHYPLDGTTSKQTFDIEVVVREARQQSGLYEEAIVFTINDEVFIPLIDHVEDLEVEDPEHYYYRIYLPVTELENGVYEISIDGTDIAMNAFDEFSSSSHWTFEVDTNAPDRPDFRLVGGFKDPTGGDRWYVDHSPDFILDFSSEFDPVTLIDIMMEGSPTAGGAANCTNISYNEFLCRFTESKSPSSQSGSFWADYGVLAKAYKILADGTQSDSGTYGPFPFTVDDVAPDFDILVQNRFMDNINLTVDAIVRNERHPLEARLDFLGESYFPIYSSNNGTFYQFIWAVGDYDNSQEGHKNISITLTDFARNSDSKDYLVYLDLTPPNLFNVSIDISDTVEIGTKLFTAQPNVTISGGFIDEDIYRVWVSPGDYDASSGTFAEKKYADIDRDAYGMPLSFSVSVRLLDPNAGTLATAPFLYDYMLINQINNMTLFVMDFAGHVSHKSLMVISDLAPPLPPTFCVGEDGLMCVPPPSI